MQACSTNFRGLHAEKGKSPYIHKSIENDFNFE